MNGIKSKSNLGRYKEILSVLNKNGLGFLFFKKHLLNDMTSGGIRARFEKSGISAGKRLFNVCEALGPTFIKIGQILSTRTDIISPDTARELALLQDSVAPVSFDVVKELIEEELSDKIENIFSYFNEKPVASASMAQVYEARLVSGLKVAVKVRRPGIEDVISTDMRILRSIARFVDKHTHYGKLYDFEGIVDEFSNILKKELDFIQEAESTERIAANISSVKGVACPKIKWVYTTQKVLTMEFVEGMKISDIPSLKKAGIDTSALADKFVSCLIMQMLKDGYFQADPHPGNEIVKKDGTLVFIDLGMAGELNDTFRKQLTEFLIGLSLKNVNVITKSIVSMGICESHINETQLSKDISRLLDRFLYNPLGKINIIDVFSGVQKVASAYKIKIPREFVMVAKCLGCAQLIVETLDPSLNIISIANAAARRLTGDYFRSERVLSDTASYMLDWNDVFKEAPVAASRMLRKLQDNDFAIDLNIKQLDSAKKTVVHALNRVTISVILLAVCIVMAGIMIAYGQYYAGTENTSVFTIGLICIIVSICAVVGILVWMLVSTLLSYKRRKK